MIAFMERKTQLSELPFLPVSKNKFFSTVIKQVKFGWLGPGLQQQQLGEHPIGEHPIGEHQLGEHLQGEHQLFEHQLGEHQL